MSKFLLTIAVLLCGLSTQAQFTKGDVLLGGQLGFTLQKNTYQNVSGDNYDGGNFLISVGKAVKENAVFGVNLSYNFNTASNNNSYTNTPLDTRSNNYAAGIFYRLYKDLGKQFYFFGEGGANYQWGDLSGKDDSGNKVVNGHTTGGEIYLAPGIAYKISKKCFLELAIPNLFTAGYSSGKTTILGEDNKSDNFGARVNLTSNFLNSLTLGFRLNL